MNAITDDFEGENLDLMIQRRERGDLLPFEFAKQQLQAQLNAMTLLRNGGQAYPVQRENTYSLPLARMKPSLNVTFHLFFTR